MKLDKGLKIGLIILLIILVSVISFVGIYVQDKNSMKNILKEYSLGMDLEGNRTVGVLVDESTKTIYYDKDGKVVEEEKKDGSKEVIPVNSKESLNKENYIASKEIVEKRLNDLGVSNYLIRLDEKTGKMIVQLPEDSRTDLAVQYIYSAGKFTMEDEDGNVLLDNSNLGAVRVGYASETTGTKVYLNLEFNKESIEKLKEISNTYTPSTDEEGNDTSKKVTMKIDGNELMSTSFSEEISNGVISLAIGNATTDRNSLNSYIEQGTNIAILVNNGKLPVVYKLNQNRYVKADITTESLKMPVLVVSIILLIACVVLIIKYKKNAILASITYIGYVAVLLLALRYANVLITLEGLFGILICVVLNYIFVMHLLRVLNRKEDSSIEKKEAFDKAIKDLILLLIPALIVGITLCFTNWISMYSFGAIIFWGILLILVYNTIVTRTLISLSSKK